MSSDIFLNSGVVVTMFNQTYVATDVGLKGFGSASWSSEASHLGFNKGIENQSNYFIIPQYSLKNLNRKVVFRNTYSLSHVLESINGDLKIEPSFVWSNSLESYKDKYSESMKCIQSGELKKAVPFMVYETSKPKNFNEFLLPQIIKKLSGLKTENEYFYGYWSQNQGFIGLSPEVLLQKKPNSTAYQTMALAGTVPTSEPNSMLLNPKLKEEHAFVMQDISNKLDGHTLNWSDPVEKVYGILKHLYATAEFKSDLSVQELIAKLSPTSALGIYPSDHWQEYKNLLGIENRGSYGAPFGWVHNDEVNIVVCLRGLFWDQQNLKIYVGGGVTAQSDFDTELKELELKFLSTKNKLGL